MTILCSKHLIYFSNKLFNNFDKLKKMTTIQSFLKIKLLSCPENLQLQQFVPNMDLEHSITQVLELPIVMTN